MEAKYCLFCGHPLTAKQVDGVQRQACSSNDCHFVYWDNPVPVVAAIVELDGQVILIHSPDWPEGMFGLVTGFLEKGESPEEGAVREVKEELGLEAYAQEFVGVYPFHLRNQVIIAYHVKAKGAIRTNEEIESYQCLYPEDLRPRPIGTGLALIDWLEGRKAAPAWH
jgi:NAD+ diphosphatase